jgi:hypothetical protein
MGEGWVGVLSPQVFCDRRVHAFEGRQDLIVPEPKNSVALVLQKTAAFGFLRRRPLVLAAIEFDNKACPVPNKSVIYRPSGTCPRPPIPRLRGKIKVGGPSI